MCEYLERDRNHPCVVDWSICNESDYGRVFSMTQRKMKSLDPTRIYSATFTDDHTLDVNDLSPSDHAEADQRVAERSKAGVLRRSPRRSSTACTISALFEDLDPGMRDYWVRACRKSSGRSTPARIRSAPSNSPGSDDAFLVPGKGIGYWRSEHRRTRYTESVYKMPKRGVIGERSGERWTAGGGRGPSIGSRRSSTRPCRSKKSRWPFPQAGKPIVIPVRKLEPVRRFGPVRLPLGTGGREGRSPRQSGADEQRHAGDRRQTAAAARRQADARSSTTSAARWSMPTGFRSSRTRFPSFPIPASPRGSPSRAAISTMPRPSACSARRWNWPTTARAANSSAP